MTKTKEQHAAQCRRAAAAIADELWPLAGDPTFPACREESHGWRLAQSEALAGMEAAEAGEQFAQTGSSLGAEAFRLGFAYIFTETE